MILGDQGADIIKIEPPMTGDLARFMGDRRNGMSAMFATLNRNKRSLVLDLKHQADKEIFLQLVASADVLIENYRPGVTRKLGIDYETLNTLNPGLVYASISGYGQTGPYQHKRVYDPLIQATAGAAAAQDRGRPQNIRTVIFDKVTGYTAAQAITAALLARAKPGRASIYPYPCCPAPFIFNGRMLCGRTHSRGRARNSAVHWQTGSRYLKRQMVMSPLFWRPMILSKSCV
jgi:crotonobetainyl-CoA:carnitine CoA-transferase CaiB-like acyl-CoA transferase